MTLPRHTLRKAERINSKITIDRLFTGGSKSMLAFPVRAVYSITEQTSAPCPPAAILVSVSKRHFKHAVKRNRVKRQIREAYRLNKHILWQAVEGSGKHIDVAFIWLSDTIETSEVVHRKVVNLLQRIAEKLTANTESHEEPAQ